MSLVPSSSHSPVVGVVRELTSAEIAGLGSTPVVIVPAIPGRTIVPVGGAFAYTFGTIAFASDGDSLVLTEDGGAVMDSLADFTVTMDFVASFVAGSAKSLAAGEALSIETGDPVGGRGPIATSSLDDAGSLWVPGDTATIAGGTAGLVTVSTVTNSFPITAISVPGKTFTVTGDASAFAPTDTFHVYRSTLNNGDYTIVSAVFGAGSTVITVVEAIPSGTANGRGGDSTAGDVGPIATYALTNAGTGYTAGSKALTAVAPSVGVDAAITVLTVTNQADGTARVTVFYAVV